MGKNIWAVVGVVVVLGLVIWAVVYSNQNSNLSEVTPVTNSTNTGNTSNTNQTNPVVTNQQANVPIVITDSKTIPTDTTVVVSGTVTPDGALTNYWFEYGKTASLGSKTSLQAIGSGYSQILSPGYITGLIKETTYYYRLVAQNSYGKVVGAQFSFQTTNGVSIPVGNAPSVKTNSASDVSRNGSTLNGTVNPNKAATQYWFEYGKTQNLGTDTSFQNVGNGTVSVASAVQVLNLDPATTYYYRLFAQNQFGTVNGVLLSFKTLGPPAPTSPSATTRSATNVKSTTATLRATVNPNGADTQYWFEYATDSALSVGLQTTSQQTVTAGTSNVAVATDITGLSTSTTYYFKIVTQNSVGTVRGDGLSFKTRSN